LKGFWRFFLIFSPGFLAILLFSVGLGTVEISWWTVLEALFLQNDENLASTLIWQVRLPRFFLACLAGGTLAVAGQSMQILVRNPLADPYTMGTASGAALGVNLAMSGWIPVFYTQYFMIPIWGFAGAMLSSILVLILASGKRKFENASLLLIGVAISILANSLISLLTYYSARQSEVRHLLFWAFGNLDKANWDSLGLAFFFSIIGLGILWKGTSSWNLLLLGEDKASSLKLNTKKSKYLLLTISAFLTASIVCLVGPIGFVGLVVPFWARKLISVTQSAFWPVTFLVGALFLSICDLIARVAFQPFGLPIGLVTSLIGVPFFLYLLRDSSRKSSF
jgi:iron complex transport system permease protein